MNSTSRLINVTPLMLISVIDLMYSSTFITIISSKYYMLSYGINCIGNSCSIFDLIIFGFSLLNSSFNNSNILGLIPCISHSMTGTTTLSTYLILQIQILNFLFSTLLSFNLNYFLVISIIFVSSFNSNSFLQHCHFLRCPDSNNGTDSSS